MSGPTYATRKDVHELGRLPRGVLGNEGRSASVLAASDTFTLNEHGYELDDVLQVRAVEGGSLPSGLVAGTTYYAIPLTPSTFQLSATEGGSAVNVGADASEVVVVDELPFDTVLEACSRWVDDFIPHLLPLALGDDGKYPIRIRQIVATLAAKHLLNHDGKASDLVDAAEKVAMAQIERWKAGQPIREAGITASSNLAVTADASESADPRGWGSGTLP